MLELGRDPATTSASTSSSSSSSSDGADLPEHGIRVGDIVLVAEQPPSGGGGARKREVREREAGGVKGVVTRVGRAGLGVAVDGEEGGRGKDEGEGGVLGGSGTGGEKRVWIVQVADDVTFKR